MSGCINLYSYSKIYLLLTHNLFKMAWLFRSLSQNKSKEDTTPKNNHPPPVTNQT